MKLFTKCWDLGQCLFEAGLVAGHADVLPDDPTEFPVEVVDGPGAIDGQPPLLLVLHPANRLGEHRVVGGHHGLP